MLNDDALERLNQWAQEHNTPIPHRAHIDLALHAAMELYTVSDHGKRDQYCLDALAVIADIDTRINGATKRLIAMLRDRSDGHRPVPWRHLGQATRVPFETLRRKYWSLEQQVDNDLGEQ